MKRTGLLLVAMAILSSWTFLAHASLIHRWDFMDGTVDDSIGVAHGTLHGAAYVDFDGWLMLDGGSETYLSLPEGVIPVDTGAVTLVAWFNQAESATNWIGLFGFGTANDDIFAFTPRGDPWGNTGAYYVRNPTAGGWGFTNEWRSLPDLRDWQDHMVALVWRDGDGTENYGTVEVYLDGVFVTSIMNEGEGPATTYTGFPEEKYRLANFSSVDNWLGRSPGDGGRGYASMTGGIREFRIYDSALSAMEIAMLRPLPEVEEPPPDDPPEAPASIDYPTDSSTGQYTVSWSEPVDAMSYRLERSPDTGATWTEVYSGTDAEYLDTVATGSYLYRVAAWNPAGGSDWTTGDHEIVVLIIPDPPEPPASITYPATSTTGRYTVSWPAAARAETYHLERSDDGAVSWVEIYSGAALSYNDTVEDGLYLYRVQARNLGGDSDWREGTVEALVTLSEQEAWCREYFADPWDDSVAGPMADANDDGFLNFMNFALRGNPLEADGPAIEPHMVWDADTGKPVFHFRVRAGDGVFSEETGGYYTDAGVAYYLETSEVPQAPHWSRMALTAGNTEIVTDGDGPALRVQVSTAIAEGGGRVRPAAGAEYRGRGFIRCLAA